MSPHRGSQRVLMRRSPGARTADLGLTPPGYTMSPLRGLECVSARTAHLGLTPPGCTMSPLRGLECVSARTAHLGLTSPGYTMSSLCGSERIRSPHHDDGM